MSVKKKIGIVTITNDGYNFGNRLQNFALQHTLQKMGFVVETLNRPIRENQQSWRYVVKLIVRFSLPYHRTIRNIKAWNFFFWNRRYIKWSDTVITDDILPLLANKYDYFIAGSDQIWNPKFIWGKDSYMFLQFAKPEQRLAYAPSIGVDEIENDMIHQYHEWWRNWKVLSCREYSGAKIIFAITGKSVPVLIDPTLLLTSEDWGQLTQGIRTPKKYIFVYMLGDITGKYKEYIDQMSREKQCEIVDVMNDIRYAGCNPSGFVALIQHAEYVVADSYHAMVFSLIFHRPFVFVDRVGWGMDMNSRVQTLQEKFDINIEQLSGATQIDVDWDFFENRLAEERTQSLKYISQSMA